MPPEQWKKIATGAVIAAVGALLTYASTVLVPAMENADNAILLTLAPIASVLLNVARKYFSDKSSPKP